MVLPFGVPHRQEKIGEAETWDCQISQDQEPCQLLPIYIGLSPDDVVFLVENDVYHKSSIFRLMDPLNISVDIPNLTRIFSLVRKVTIWTN